MTPEGKVKAKVKRVLASYEQTTTGDWPVPSGYGKSTVDYIGCNVGRYFVIETKADKKKPTKLQELFMMDVQRCGGKAFVIGTNGGVDDPAFEDLIDWLV